MNITVYCASSDRIDDAYKQAAVELGRRLGEAGHTLVYGGGKVGLMGILAEATHEHGGRVFGIIPKALRLVEGVAYEVADELVETQTMQERKAFMFNLADAFIVLPGGFGTLEELMEVLTLKQLGYHDKPIALVDTNGFYQPLLALFEHYYAERFARAKYRHLYHIAPTPAEALAYIADYRSAPTGSKWE